MVEEIGVGDAVDRRVDGDGEEDHGGDVSESGCDTRNHSATGHGLHEDEEGHDGEDIVVG